MYHTCLYCTKDLGTNEVLETLPIGRRVAFDAAQGRLWVVCRSCAKWNLVPFDTRLETIDACERLFRDTRTRYSTDNIGLARVAEGLDLIRIGAPQRPEFASWRYGAQYRRRRLRAYSLSAVGFASYFGAGAVIPSVLSTLGVWGGVAAALAPYGPALLVGAILSRRRRIIVRLPGTNRTTAISPAMSAVVHARFSGDQVLVQLPLTFIDDMRKRHITVEGPEARLLARRILALLNRRTGSKRELGWATQRLEQGIPGWLYWKSKQSRPWIRSDAFKGDVTRFKPGYDPSTFQLSGFSASDLLAIEMWLSEEDEAKALAGELALLERQWQEAEELAAIADSLAVSEDVHTQVGRGR
ncbi:MAG TPA: hypothetical protein VID74_04400 [Gemmatimonadales bacterium]